MSSSAAMVSSWSSSRAVLLLRVVVVDGNVVLVVVGGGIGAIAGGSVAVFSSSRDSGALESGASRVMRARLLASERRCLRRGQCLRCRRWHGHRVDGSVVLVFGGNVLCDVVVMVVVNG